MSTGNSGPDGGDPRNADGVDWTHHDPTLGPPPPLWLVLLSAAFVAVGTFILWLTVALTT